MKNLINIIAAACLTITGGMTAYGRAATVRAVDTQKMPDGTYVPESFETDVHKMMENWYMRNYASIDKDADSRADVPTDEREYIDRLQRMNTIIEMPYNKEVRGFIDMYVGRKKELVETMLGMSLYYMPIFEQALDKYGMPMELKYLPVIESALNPNAVSKAGATGLWQFMTGTATPMGLEVNSVVDERRDPYKSSDAAARYLKQLYNTYGDWSLAIAAYNCGPGNVNKALRRAGGGKKDFWEIYRFLPAETRGYVPAFIAANYAMTYYNKHNISPALAQRPILTDTVHVNRRVHFEQISEVLGIPIDELRVLNPQYRHDIIPGHVRPYALILPNIQTYCYIANEDSIVNHNAEKYAMRDVVEPNMSNKSKDDRGEYVEELVVKYHKVKRHETLSSIAKAYGVSASSISKANNIGRKVKRGQKLKINTYRRRYIEPEETAPADSVQVTDSVSLSETPQQIEREESEADAKVKESMARAEERQATKKAKNNNKSEKKEKKAKATTHTVKSGDSLFKLAKQYGTTVDAIRDANGMSNDNINIGQKLTIPAKGSTVNSNKKSSGKKKGSSRKSKSKKRRR